MLWNSRKRHARRASAFAPQLLSLEDRCCPSIATSFHDGTLNISATDNAANNVQITTQTGGLLNVTSGTLNNNFNNVNNIILRLNGNAADVLNLDLSNATSPVRLAASTGSGNDQVTVKLGALSGAADLDVTLGGGNDTFTLNGSGQIGNNANVRLNVDAGAGNDTVNINLGAIGSGSGSGSGGGADVRVTANLGTGNDKFNLTSGDLAATARLRLNVRAGAGDDAVTLDLGSRTNTQVRGTIDLGPGTDTFTDAGSSGRNSDRSLEVVDRRMRDDRGDDHDGGHDGGHHDNHGGDDHDDDDSGDNGGRD